MSSLAGLLINGGAFGIKDGSFVSVGVVGVMGLLGNSLETCDGSGESNIL